MEYTKRQERKGKIMKKTILLTALLALLFTACSKKEDKKVEEELIRPVKILAVKNIGNQKKYLEYPGVVYPSLNTIMAFEVSGTIKKFHVKVGDYINKGDVLATLDKRNFISNVKAAKAGLNSAAKDLKRAKILIKSGAISQRDFDNAKQRYENAKSKYEIHEKALEDTNLVAEFSGVIAKKMVNDFARISPKQGILLLQNNSKLEVKIDIPEKDIIKSKGDLKNVNKIINAKITITALENKHFPALIKEISTSADYTTRTFEVTLLMENPKEETVLPGMSATVRLSRKVETNAIYIPSHYVKSNETKRFYVWTLDKENKAKKTFVEVGEFNKDKLHIKKGLNKNSKIIISGLAFLYENMKVRELK